MTPPRHTSGYYRSNNSGLHPQNSGISRTRPARVDARRHESSSPSEGREKAMQVFCAGAVARGHAQGSESIEEGGEGEGEGESSIDQAEKENKCLHGVIQRPGTQQHRSLGHVRHDEAEASEPDTDIDEYGDPADTWDKPKNTMETIYVVEKTYGSVHAEPFEEETSTATVVAELYNRKDANELASSYFRSGKYTDVLWKKLEESTQEDGSVEVHAETEHFWYRVLVCEKKRLRKEPPFVYVVQEVKVAYRLREGSKNPVECTGASRLGVFRDRRSANAYVRKSKAAFYSKQMSRGYVRKKFMKHGLLTIKDYNHGNREAGGSITVTVERVPLW